ncbi:MAG: hypothetical protein ACREBG_20365 [Pyrinomonadaceae bacterium]
MAISNELSSEIATALFAAKERSPRELSDLKDMVFEIHSTLQQLTENARADRRHPERDTQNSAAAERFFIKGQS